MKYFNDTISSGQTFEERIGDPDKFDASLGRIVEGFSFLERTLSNVIILILDVTNEIGNIITAELSYKNKINLFSSLFKNNIDIFKKVHSDIETQFTELLSLCNKAEEIRNQIIHSSYVSDRYRVKVTAKAKKGLNKNVEEVNPDHLLNIADFIVYVGMSVEAFPLVLGIVDRVGGAAEDITYSKNNKIIKKFGNL